VERDAQPDEFDEAWWKCSGGPQGTVECAERLGDLVQAADNGRDAKVDPIALTQVDNGDVGKYRRGCNTRHDPNAAQQSLSKQASDLISHVVQAWLP
jgi:hypothetical protein